LVFRISLLFITKKKINRSTCSELLLKPKAVFSLFLSFPLSTTIPSTNIKTATEVCGKLKPKNPTFVIVSEADYRHQMKAPLCVN